MVAVRLALAVAVASPNRMTRPASLCDKPLPTTLAEDPNNPLHTVSRVTLVLIEPRPRSDLPNGARRLCR